MVVLLLLGFGQFVKDRISIPKRIPTIMPHGEVGHEPLREDAIGNFVRLPGEGWLLPGVVLYFVGMRESLPFHI